MKRNGSNYFSLYKILLFHFYNEFDVLVVLGHLLFSSFDTFIYLHHTKSSALLDTIWLTVSWKSSKLLVISHIHFYVYGLDLAENRKEKRISVKLLFNNNNGQKRIDILFWDSDEFMVCYLCGVNKLIKDFGFK